MEDRKFADIGSTVKKQFTQSVFKYSKWADLVTCHLVSGPDVIRAFPIDVGIVLIAEMSSEGSLSCAEVAQEVIATFGSQITGYVGQRDLAGSFKHSVLQMTPGVSLISSNDGLGQRYKSPEDAIRRDLADLIIVGRGITSFKGSDEEGLNAAQKYREAGWRALKYTKVT